MVKNPFMYVIGNFFLSVVSLTREDGSVEFQVFGLTKKIERLSSHLELHKKDYSSQRGLRKIAGKRQRLLAYLSKKNKVRYIKLIGQLNIRDKKKAVNLKFSTLHLNFDKPILAFSNSWKNKSEKTL